MSPPAGLDVSVGHAAGSTKPSEDKWTNMNKHITDILDELQEVYEVGSDVKGGGCMSVVVLSDTLFIRLHISHHL